MFVKRTAEAADDHPANELRVAETHLGLRGMDVHVDLARRYIEEERDDRMAVAREQVGIGAAQRADEQPVLHRAPVDEQILMIGDAAIVGWQADHAAQMHVAAVHIDPDAVRGEIALGQRRDARQLVLPALHIEHAAPVVLDGEADVGPRHREPLHDVEARGIFAAPAAQEFTPRGHAREQIFDHHARTFGERRGPFGNHRAIVDDTLPAFAARDAAFERQPRDARDRGQSLAAKPERRDLLDRIVGQFRRRMAFERERHVGRGHPAPVILDFEARNPALGDSHRNASRTGVDGIFNQFLERSGGSFNHFTGRDPIY